MDRLFGKRRSSSKKHPLLPQISSLFLTKESSDSTTLSEDVVTEEVFYDCISHDEVSPRQGGHKKPVQEHPTHPHHHHHQEQQKQERRFPLTLASNHHYVTPEDFEKYRKTNPEKLRNTYSEPPAQQFQVRGPEYLSQAGKNQKHLKVPSEPSAYSCIGVTMFRCPVKFTHMSHEIQPLKRFFDSHEPDAKDAVFSKFLVINWIVAPLFGTECYVCCHVFQLQESIVKDKLHLQSAFARFRQSSDAEKSNQFKWLGKIVEGPRAITMTMSMLGAERPVLICNQLLTTHFQGKNYLEVTNDVSSSRIAAANCGTILKNLHVVVMDMAWVLEGQRPEDLPENILCSIRWVWNTMEDLVTNLNESGELLVPTE